MELIFTTALALHLLAPPSAMPVEYTATSPHAASLSYDPSRGWVPATECPRGCYVAADQPVQLLQGEIGLEALADLAVDVRRDGIAVVSCFRFFGDVPVCMREAN